MARSMVWLWASHKSRVCEQHRAVTAPRSLWYLAGSSGVFTREKLWLSCPYPPPGVNPWGRKGWGRLGVWRAFVVFSRQLAARPRRRLCWESESLAPSTTGHTPLCSITAARAMSLHTKTSTLVRDQLGIVQNRDLLPVGRVHSRTQPTALVGWSLPTVSLHFHSCFLAVAQGRAAPGSAVKLSSTTVNTDPFLYWKVRGSWNSYFYLKY